MARLAAFRPHLRRRWLAVLAVPATLAAIVVVFASPFLISSISMASTIQPGEIVLVDRVNTGLQHGEVIVFYPPGNTSGVPFIKRVIGLPGDHISITQCNVSVNGVQLSEPYVAPETCTLTSVADYELTVPAGTVFVLGDDRWYSWDSRDYGPVPFGRIVGRAWVAVSLAPAISIL